MRCLRPQAIGTARCRSRGMVSRLRETGETVMTFGRQIDVESSGVIDAPVEVVWSLVRDFNNVARWHPDVVESHLESGAGSEPGAVRALRLRNGMLIRERLL